MVDIRPTGGCSSRPGPVAPSPPDQCWLGLGGTGKASTIGSRAYGPCRSPCTAAPPPDLHAGADSQGDGQERSGGVSTNSGGRSLDIRAGEPGLVEAMAHGVGDRPGALRQDGARVPGVGLLHPVLHPRPRTGMGHIQGRDSARPPRLRYAGGTLSPAQDARGVTPLGQGVPLRLTRWCSSCRAS